MRARLTAALIHLGISLAIAAVAAMLVFVLWYPAPYGELSGGRELFVLVIAVDVIIGPLLTFVVFSRGKRKAELRRDIATVGVLQLIALTYGLWTVAVARPIQLAFEFDRFRVVHATDVPEELVSRSPAGVKVFPWSGPRAVAVRAFVSPTEEIEATMAALQGIPLSARPDLWEPYELARPRIIAAARPATELQRRFPNRGDEIEDLISKLGRTTDTVRYLPVSGRHAFWTAFLDPTTGTILAFYPLDSF